MSSRYTAGLNPFASLARSLVAGSGVFLPVAGFLILLGLFAATFSTASTQLVASGHALQLDVLKIHRDLDGRRRHKRISQLLVVTIALLSTAVVYLLVYLGFSIADLVFAVYGAQLGLVPVVLFALYGSRERLAPVGPFASVAVLSGFVSGWLAAGIGKAAGSSDLVYLAPAVSLAVSGVVVAIGLCVPRPRG